MYEILAWPLSDPIACEMHGASRERQTSRVVCVGLLIQVQRLCQTCPCISRTPCFGSNWVFREVTPVGHSNLNTDRTDYSERCWKTISHRLDPVECY